MSERVKDSKFLYREPGGFLSLAYYVVDSSEIGNDELHRLLIECGACENGDRSPATDYECAAKLAERYLLNDSNAIAKRGKEWIYGYITYGGRVDPLSISPSFARCICFAVLRYPEIDRTLNNLPYDGWSTRYDKEK